MTKIELLQTVQIPDETWDPAAPENEGKAPPTATNYRGAVLDVGDSFAKELLDAGKARKYIRPEAAEQAAAEAGTVAGPASEELSDAGRASAIFAGRVE